MEEAALGAVVCHTQHSLEESALVQRHGFSAGNPSALPVFHIHGENGGCETEPGFEHGTVIFSIDTMTLSGITLLVE